MEQYEIHIQNDFNTRSVAVWVTKRCVDGSKNISQNRGKLIETLIDPCIVRSSYLKPFLSLPSEFAAHLFKAISDNQHSMGIKTPEENLITGKLQATESHLADMREINKKILDFITTKKD